MGTELTIVPTGGDLSVDHLTYPEELFYGPGRNFWHYGTHPDGRPLPCLRCGALVPASQQMFERHFHWHKVIEP